MNYGLIENCRCFRMNKTCQPSPPMRRHRTPKRLSPHDTSKLEEKLDGLVTLLTSATQAMPMAINGPPMDTSPESLMPENDNLTPSSADSSVVGQGEHSRNRPTTPGSEIRGFDCTLRASSSSISTQRQFTFDPSLEPGPEDAELYLNIFRANFVKYLPFIVISKSVSANQLRRDRPLLWSSIMTVASNQSTQQIRLSNAMTEILSREAFVKGTRNMDLLLAILVYTAW
jgi:hypothetical protein